MSEVVVQHGRVQIAGQELPSDFWGDEPPTEYRKTATVLARKSTEPFTVHTPEGVMDGEPGDYIVTDNPPTHAWPVRGSVFEATYVPAGDVFVDEELPGGGSVHRRTHRAEG
jgi:hypothetical protein